MLGPLTEYSTSLACLQYLHENGCPWSYTTCRIYAIENNLECLVYAHEHGAPWSDNIFTSIYKMGDKRKNYTDVLQYMRDHGCPDNNDASSS